MAADISDIGLHLSENDELQLSCNTEEGRVSYCDNGSHILPLLDHDECESTLEKRPDLLNSVPINDSKKIFSWLTTCKRNHEKCNANIAGVPPLPTRAIDVAAVDDVGNAQCRLVLSEGKHDEYITLSHCWGGVHQGMVLTSNNMTSMLAGFPDTALPKSFADAVWLTRNLGKRYLWIDSLCIIQPTAEESSDWAIEGAKMSDVYSNSWLTIAASSAYNSFEGCLFGRLGSEFEIRPAPLFEHTSHRDWNGGANYFNRNPDWSPMVIPSPPSWVNVVQNSPLGSRAWVLQERMLSRRTLYSSVQGFFWECAHMRASLYEPLGCATDYMFHDHDIKTINQLLADEQSENLLGLHWRRIVEYYTRLKLTVETDRLPAIAGLAQRLAVHTHDTYLVGHWESTLPSSLLWFRLEDATGAKPRPVKKELPSWSWAAMPGAVKFTPMDVGDFPARQINHHNIVASVASITRDERRDRKSPQDVIIQMCGRLRQLKFGQTVPRLLIKQKTIKGYWAGYLPGINVRIPQLCPIFLGSSGDEFSEDGTSVELIYDAEEHGNREDIVLLQILRLSECHEGLVLRRCAGEKTFKRVGFFTSRYQELFDGVELDTLKLI